MGQLLSFPTLDTTQKASKPKVPIRLKDCLGSSEDALAHADVAEAAAALAAHELIQSTDVFIFDCDGGCVC